MSLEKTTAIVLRVVEFSETSCIVTMMTREYGKITVMAKGARRPKSPFEAALDVLSVCRIVFIKKHAATMDLLTEAKLERRFRAAASSLDRLYAGYYVAELLKLLTDDADPHPDLFDLAIRTIDTVDTKKMETNGAQSVDEVVLNFELAALRCLGHLPMLTRCVSCGKEKTTLNRVNFGMNSGGILCQTCRPGERNVISLSSDGFTFLLDRANQSQRTASQNLNNATVNAVQEVNTHIYNAPFDLLSEASRLESIKEESISEVRGLVRSYITHLIGYPPRLQKFLNTTGPRSVANVH